MPRRANGERGAESELDAVVGFCYRYQTESDESRRMTFKKHRPRRLERRMAAVREPAMCRCTTRLAFRAVDSLLVLGLQVVQGSALNFFIIWHNHKNSAYFWFIADLCVVMMSMGAMLTSYHHVRVKTRRKIQPMGHAPQPLSKPRWPRYGAIPFAYTAWFVYSCFLVAKLAMMYRTGVMAELKPENRLSPQLLRAIISLSAIVFFLEVQAYHNAESNSTRRVALLGTSLAVVLEILDSVDFFGVLLGGAFELPMSLETAILALTAVNLVLPSVVLFRLCVSDFDERAEPRMLSLAHITFKTFVIDLPFFAIRIFLWTNCNYVNVSGFLAKNLLYMVAWFRFSLPEGIAALKDIRREAILRQERAFEPPRRVVHTVQLTSVSPIGEEQA